ncbi:hypothetical protein [Kitasatospora sp. LaBMicrA B282]|uniref:hypothetical protein n=1 Tax=Kitasatospora sp. LaBMicrA B282 TaxID=3420949 RepID=UPI003D1346E3
MAALSLVLSFLDIVIQLVFPQTSADRLAWWRARWTRPTKTRTKRAGKSGGEGGPARTQRY